jgi:hypothetical protein
MTAARIGKIVARIRRQLPIVQMAERARTGRITTSHNPESTLNQCASVGSVSLVPAYGATKAA